MENYSEECIEAFLKNQRQLYDEPVASSYEVVLHSVKEVREYLENAGMDVAELSDDDLLEASEVFTVGDGSYLIVEA